MSIYTSVIGPGKKLINGGARILFHNHHKHEAYTLIRNMNKSSGGDSSTFKKCDEYSHDVLGSIKYAPWLKAYSVFCGTFKEGWIPDNYYAEIVVPKLKGDYGKISACKSISSRLFKTDLIPDLVYSVNGLLYTTSLDLLQPAELKQYLFSKATKVVYKKDSGLQGRSVHIYEASNFPDETCAFDNGVFQSYIDQHSFFDKFANNSVATIRITTVVDNLLNIKCRAAYLRLPRSKDTHVVSSSAIKVAINLDNGELHEKGYLPNWSVVSCHSDSHEKFIYQKIPVFQKCVDICISLHREMPFARVIGWDLIVDSKENIKVMEWNGGHNDIKFSEASTGPCFADLGWESLWRMGV